MASWTESGSVGLIEVIVPRAHGLIRPPRAEFEFSWLHGIKWAHVKDEPTFREVWRELAPMLTGANFFAAHNAPFDRGVLEECCRVARRAPPRLRFECTVQLARRTWGIYPTKLPNLCEALGIPLKHHEVPSDAEACVRIVLAATTKNRGAGTTDPSDRRRRSENEPSARRRFLGLR